MKLVVLIIGLGLPCLSGCAAFCKRIPTPAAKISAEDLLASQPPANERYYILFFGSERPIPFPRYTHTWATVIKVTGEPESPDCKIQVDTISWMPATLVIHPVRIRVEEGVNLSLEETIEEMLRHKEEILMWGPYEIWHGSYTRFLTQKAFMESGQVGYQCVDTFGEAGWWGKGCDCIHAISDMDPLFDRKHYALYKHGVRATQNIVNQMLRRPIILNAPTTHDWLISRLKLDTYPITRRTYRGPVTPSTPEAIRQFVLEKENPHKHQKKYWRIWE